jgi:hypothetical protein
MHTKLGIPNAKVMPYSGMKTGRRRKNISMTGSFIHIVNVTPDENRD